MTAPQNIDELVKDANRKHSWKVIPCSHLENLIGFSHQTSLRYITQGAIFKALY